jgi:hypothetical protein
MKYSNIFWGIVLITIGTLFALKNFDVIYFSWHSFFRLWPFLLVFWGLSVIPIKGLYKFILTVVFVGLAIFILFQDPHHHYSGFDISWDDEKEYVEEAEEVEVDDQYADRVYDGSAEFAELNMTAGAGEFEIKNTTSYLFKFKSEGNTGTYLINTQQVDGVEIIDVKHDKPFIKSPKIKNEVWLELHPDPIWDINIDVGAASMELDLRSFKVKEITLDGGASEIELKLGNNIKRTDVKINAGAASIEIKIPKECACEVETTTVLSSRDFDGFNKIRKGLYQTNNFSDSSNQIFINIDAAVSSVEIIRY